MNVTQYLALLALPEAQGLDKKTIQAVVNDFRATDKLTFLKAFDTVEYIWSTDKWEMPVLPPKKRPAYWGWDSIAKTIYFPKTFELKPSDIPVFKGEYFVSKGLFEEVVYGTYKSRDKPDDEEPSS